jgi:hypothetical protein
MRVPFAKLGLAVLMWSGAASAVALAQYYPPAPPPPGFYPPPGYRPAPPPPPGYYRPPRGQGVGYSCATSRGYCDLPGPRPLNSRCRCYIPGFGEKRGAVVP